MAESSPFHVLNSETHIIKSKSINYEYQLSIVKPFSYNDDAQLKFPCLVLLDPGILQVLIAAISQFLHFSGFPGFITAGIGPISPHPFGKYSEWLPNSFCTRFRDYTPGKDDLIANYVKEQFGYNGDFGGASDYLRLIKNEIIPFLDSEYRVEMSDLSLMGHSLGGFFVLYSLFNEPDLFRGYASMSPFLVFDDSLIFNIEEQFFKTNNKLSAKLFMSVGTEEDSELGVDMVSNLHRFSNSVISRNYEDLHIIKRVYEGYGHNDVIPDASVEALKFLYSK